MEIKHEAHLSNIDLVKMRSLLTHTNISMATRQKVPQCYITNG